MKRKLSCSFLLFRRIFLATLLQNRDLQKSMSLKMCFVKADHWASR